MADYDLGDYLRKKKIQDWLQPPVDSPASTPTFLPSDSAQYSSQDSYQSSPQDSAQIPFPQATQGRGAQIPFPQVPRPPGSPDPYIESLKSSVPPQRSDYIPSRKGKIGGILAGVGAGILTGDIGKGMQAYQDVAYAPYKRASGEYQREMKNRLDVGRLSVEDHGRELEELRNNAQIAHWKAQDTKDKNDASQLAVDKATTTWQSNMNKASAVPVPDPWNEPAGFKEAPPPTQPIIGPIDPNRSIDLNRPITPDQEPTISDLPSKVFDPGVSIPSKQLIPRGYQYSVPPAQPGQKPDESNAMMIPPKNVVEQQKAEELGKTLIPTPPDLVEELGSMATRDQIAKYYARKKDPKKDETYHLNIVSDPGASPELKQISRNWLAEKAKLAQNMHVTVGGGDTSGGYADLTSATDPKAIKFDRQVRDKAIQEPTLDYDALTYLLYNGKLNIRGRSKDVKAEQNIIKHRAGQIMRDLNLDPGEIFARSAELKANMGALTKFSNYSAMIDAFQDTLHRNADYAQDLSNQYKRGDVQIYNKVLNAFNTGRGDPGALKLAAQLHGVAREWAKIMQGSVSAAGVSISEAKQADAIIASYLSKGQLDGLVEVLNKDAENRTGANHAEKDRLLGGIRGSTRPGNAGGEDLVEVISPEGIPGTIPRNKLEDAKKRKFKVVGAQ